MLTAAKLTPGQDAAEPLARLLAELGTLPEQATAEAQPAERPVPVVQQPAAAGAAPSTEPSQPTRRPQRRQEAPEAAGDAAGAAAGPVLEAQQAAVPDGDAAMPDGEALAPARGSGREQEAAPPARKRGRPPKQKQAQEGEPQPAAKQRRTLPAEAPPRAHYMGAAPGGDAKRGRGGGLCRWVDVERSGEPSCGGRSGTEGVLGRPWLSRTVALAHPRPQLHAPPSCSPGRRGQRKLPEGRGAAHGRSARLPRPALPHPAWACATRSRRGALQRRRAPALPAV